jgi:hypothetical protein
MGFQDHFNILGSYIAYSFLEAFDLLVLFTYFITWQFLKELFPFLLLISSSTSLVNPCLGEILAFQSSIQLLRVA